MTRLSVVLPLLLLAYLLFLVVTAPAAPVYGWLQSVSPVQLRGVEGRLLQGSAQLDLPGELGTLQRAEWVWHPAALLGGRLELGLRLADAQVSGDLRLAWGLNGLQARQVQLQTEGPFLGRLAGGLRLGGRLLLDLDRVTTGAEGLPYLQGTVRWENALIDLFQPTALGNLGADFVREGENSIGALSDFGGALEVISGTLVLRQPDQILLRAQLRPRPEADPGLVSALRQLGRRQPDGSLAIEENFTLAELRGG